MHNLLLCAAVEAELSPLLPSLQRSGDHRWLGTLAGVGVEARAIGIGPVEAALGAAGALATQPFDAAIFLGTCGALPGAGLSIGEAVVVAQAQLASAAAAAGLAYVPGRVARPCLAAASLVAGVVRHAGLRRVGCATTAAITRDPENARALARTTGCQVEHLEAHSFLRAAERAGVPATCILGVANHVGPDAHAEWIRNAPAAAIAAVEALQRFLAAQPPD